MDGQARMKKLEQSEQSLCLDFALVATAALMMCIQVFLPHYLLALSLMDQALWVNI